MDFCILGSPISEKRPHPYGCGQIFLLAGLEGVLQADGAVENQMAGSAVLAVGAEVTQTHELEAHRSLGIGQGCFHLAAGENLQGVGVQAGQIVLACGIGIGIIKQVAVLTDLCVHCGGSVNPVDGSALDLAAVGRIAAPGLGVIGGQNFHNIAVLVGNAAGALDQVGTLQPALGAIGVQPLVLGETIANSS